MSTVKSNELLQELRKQVVALQYKTTHYLGIQPAAILQHVPAPCKWSAVQCLEHLNTYGRYYLPALEQVIATAEKSNSRSETTFKSSWLGAYFTRLMQPTENGQLRSRMKSPKGHIPAVKPEETTVLNEFGQQLEQLENLLSRAGKINIRNNKVATSLSRFIKLSVGDTFGFLIAHIHRHVLQAERAMADSPHPALKAV
ncbi:DinB family protein [Chitinophaga sp. 22321]|uniref:DinB family protein n=1 Tax=Chitinophaga hostae TaxID=2831022 RepID=A0ABS5ITC9_9BACT|nr:DinB family protein [Chitinophaga hostae]MBS0026160.1 DinB family protein [Chitinophaga hostae]